MDSSTTWCMTFVPSVWGSVHSRWARCKEGVRRAAAHCSSTAGSHSWWRAGAARSPISGRATPRAVGGPAPIHGLGPSRRKGGAPSPVAP